MENRTTIQVSNDLRKKLRHLAARRDESYQDLLKDMVSVFSELDRDKTIISIPKKLTGRINYLMDENDFNSVSEYVTFLLRMMLYEKAEKEKIDEKKIKKRLKLLGYI